MLAFSGDDGEIRVNLVRFWEFEGEGMGSVGEIRKIMNLQNDDAVQNKFVHGIGRVESGEWDFIIFTFLTFYR